MKKRLLSVLLLLSLLFSFAFAEEAESSFFHLKLEPHVTLIAPIASQSYDAGGKLFVRATGKHVHRLEVTLIYEGESTTVSVNGDTLEHTFDTQQFIHGATVTLIGYGDADAYGYEMTATQSVSIISPREKLLKDMFALAYANFKDPFYYHAPARNDGDRGICKNFVMRMFDTFKDAYAMKEYPELPLHMPKNNSKVNCKPYDYGVEWRDETAADGSPFFVAASFRYDPDLSKEDNMLLCRAVLESVQMGDFFQMSGNYYYGNGAHSMLFIADYNPTTDEVRWTDSNMKNDTVNGEHWGYMQYDAVRDADWFIEAICLRTRGCTLYRLRDDLFLK